MGFFRDCCKALKEGWDEGVEELKAEKAEQAKAEPTEPAAPPEPAESFWQKATRMWGEVSDESDARAAAEAAERKRQGLPPREGIFGDAMGMGDSIRDEMGGEGHHFGRRD